jgi:hypothetical protein
VESFPEAEREMERLGKRGHPVSPVHVLGRPIAPSFWGQSWCRNLGRNSDFDARQSPRCSTTLRVVPSMGHSVLDMFEETWSARLRASM